MLGDQLSKSEAELVGTKEELAKANAANQQAETDRLKALERERAMDAELTVRVPPAPPCLVVVVRVARWVGCVEAVSWRGSRGV